MAPSPLSPVLSLAELSPRAFFLWYKLWGVLILPVLVFDQSDFYFSMWA